MGVFPKILYYFKLWTSDIQKKDKARRSADRKKGPMFKLPGQDISAAVREISKKSYNKGDFVEVPVKLARTKPTRLY